MPRVAAAVGCALVLLTAGCGDAEDDVTLPALHFEGTEDEPLDGVVSIPNGWAYSIAQGSSEGDVTIDPISGQFRFVPKADHFGDTTFTYAVRKGLGQFEKGSISIYINPVNDPPQIATIGDIPNSPDEFVQSVQINAQDVDGDVSTFTATTEQTDIAGYELDEETGKLRIFPRSAGVAIFRVTAADDEYSDEEEFRFVVGRVTRRNTLAGESLAEETVEVLNPLEVPVAFHLNVNDRLFPGSIFDILERFGRSSPDAAAQPLADDAIIKSVWEGLASSVSRGYTLTDRLWLHDPVILLNSVGAAYCDDFAGAFYALLEEAGYPSRVWTLNGHVVPEVFENDAWRLYDPDMGVYYLRADGEVAGVEDLAASPDLITQPLGGEHLAERVGDSIPYSEEVAAIFSSIGDNMVWDHYMTLPEERTFEIELPPGASLAFPGGWSAPPPDFAGRLPISYANLKVTMPGGWAGSFSVPLVLLDIRGYGTVEIAGEEFAVGSLELKAAIESRMEFIEEVSIKRADTDLELIYMINPAIISTDNSYLVELEGVKVAALKLSRAVLQAQATLLN